MADAKGLVYLKRGNTGAAAWDQPYLKLGATPIDVITQELKTKGGIEAQKLAQKRDAALKTLQIDLEGWDYDNKRFFSELEGKLKQEGAALAIAGKDPNNYADKDVFEWQKRVDEGKKAALASTNQGEMYKAAVDLVTKDPEKYDTETSLNNLKGYMYMNPVERLKVDPQGLVVFRYDPLKPIEKLDINKFTRDYKFSTPTSEISTNPLEAKKLRNEIRTLVENPQNAEYYENNKDKFGWKSQDDYVEYLYKTAENRYMKKYSGAIKERSAANSGTGYLDVTPATQLGTSSPYARKSSTKGMDAVQLGDINAVISGNDAYTAKDYTSLGSDTRQIKTGAMVNVVVNDKGEVLSIPYNSAKPNQKFDYSIFDVTTGKNVKINGTHDEIAAEVVKGNLGSYKPMVYGLTATYKGDGEQEQDVEVWVKPEAIINGVNGAKFAPAYNELVRRAGVLNKKGARPTLTEWKKLPGNSGKTADDYNKEFGLE